MNDAAAGAAIITIILSFFGIVIFIGLIVAVFKINGNVRRIYELLKRETIKKADV